MRIIPHTSEETVALTLNLASSLQSLHLFWSQFTFNNPLLWLLLRFRYIVVYPCFIAVMNRHRNSFKLRRRMCAKRASEATTWLRSFSAECKHDIHLAVFFSNLVYRIKLKLQYFLMPCSLNYFAKFYSSVT